MMAGKASFLLAVFFLVALFIAPATAGDVMGKGETGERRLFSIFYGSNQRNQHIIPVNLQNHSIEMKKEERYSLQLTVPQNWQQGIHRLMSGSRNKYGINS